MEDEEETLQDCFGPESEESDYWLDKKEDPESPKKKAHNPLCLVIEITREERKEPCKQWEKAIFVK